MTTDTDFPPFPTNTFAPTELPVTRHAAGIVQIGTSSDNPNATQEEPRRRGPRRHTTAGIDEQAARTANPNATVEAEAPAKRKGRPPKAAAVPGAPLSTASLFQVLAGLQSADVVPLTSCYETLNALPPEDRSRVLGFLNRVLG